jgi:hypothetical protein
MDQKNVFLLYDQFQSFSQNKSKKYIPIKFIKSFDIIVSLDHPIHPPRMP